MSTVSHKEIRSNKKRLSTNNPYELPNVESAKEKHILNRKKSYLFQNKCKVFIKVHWKGMLNALIVLMFGVVCCCRPPIMVRSIVSICIMLSFWVTDSIPVEIASIIPIALFPILNIMTSEQVAVEYFSEVTVLVLIGFMISGIIESSNLHKMIAVRLILIVGFRVKVIHAIIMIIFCILGILSEDTFVFSVTYSVVRAVLIILEEEGVCKMYKSFNR